MQKIEAQKPQFGLMSPWVPSSMKVCWDCLRAKPESEMKPYDPVPGLKVWVCGCGQSALPPFMTVSEGKVQIMEDLTGKPLPQDWVGVCVSSNDAKAFWYIGNDWGERSFFRLPNEIVTLKAAHAYVEALSNKSCHVSKEAAALWKAIENVPAVVCESLPGDLPKDWIIMNAPRPLLGDKVEQGQFMHGVHYAAINPGVEFADELMKRNLMDDARVVFVANMETQTAMALETISPEYQETYRKMPATRRADAIKTFVLKLNRGKTYCEILELARRAGVAMQEEQLLKMTTTA